MLTHAELGQQDSAFKTPIQQKLLGVEKIIFDRALAMPDEFADDAFGQVVFDPSKPDDPAATLTASELTDTDSPPLTSSERPADTDTDSELTDTASPATASSTRDDATRTEPSPDARPKWNTTPLQPSKLPDPDGRDDSRIPTTV